MTPASTVDLRDRFMEIISKATVKTIQDLCGENLSLGKSFLKGKRDQHPFGVGGMIGLSSSNLSGSIGLLFPKMVFLNFASKMLGDEQKIIDENNEDAAAELLNIIFGLAKTLLNKEGNAVKMAIPSVLRGGPAQSSYSKVDEVRVLPFVLDDGSEFYIEFVLRRLDEKEVKEQAEIHQAKPAPLQSSPAAMAAFFKPFMESVVTALQIQCQMDDIRPAKPFSRRASNDYSFDIAGMIGITSKTITGSFLLTFPKDVYLGILSRMLGATYTDLEPGLEDAASELVNIVFGRAKAILNKEGHGLAMAIPSVVFGRSIYSSIKKTKNPGVVIPFDCGLGRFFAEIILE